MHTAAVKTELQKNVPDPVGAEVVVFPATIAQQGFWFLDQVDPGNPAYNIAVRFRLRGPLRIATLRQAFQEIVRRHETLRTTFAIVNGDLAQVISSSATIEPQVVDLTGVPRAERDAEADRRAEEEACKRFDLSALPLIRAVVLRLDEQDFMLLVTVHHIVSDGWSIGIISHELGCLYDEISRGVASTLPAIAIQYGDFALWQQKWLRKAGLDDQLAYWKRQLAGVAQLDLPTDRPRAANQTFHGKIDSILLSRELTDALRDVSNRLSSTMFMTSLAALKILLHKYSGQTDICVGSLVAGRSRVETEPLIGLFVNPIVLRTDLSGNPLFSDLVSRVRETVLGAMSNQDLSFLRLIEELRPKRDPSRHPIFQVNFIYQRDFVRPMEFSDLTLTAVPSKSPGAIYDLNFFMVERGDGWRASCEYNTDLFEAATIQRMLRQFQALLEGVVADSARSIAAFPLLTNEDQRRVFILPPLGDTSDSSRASSPPITSSTEPRDEIEKSLLKIWRKLLGTQEILVTDSFFELGGHSLMAAKLLSQVERAFGNRMSLVEFLRAPTIEQLASQLREGGASSNKPPVVMMNPNGTKPPIVVLGGPEFRPLAYRLGPDQPILGLPVPRPEDLPSLKVEDIATGLRERLLQVKPRGPYFLAAWCNSGIFAYELAMQLRAKGHLVPRVIFFDTVNTHYAIDAHELRTAKVRVSLIAVKLKHHLSQASRLGFAGGLSYMAREGKSSAQKRWRKIWRGLHKLRPAQLPVKRLGTTAREAEAELAFDKYQFKKYTGSVLLFRSTLLQAGRYDDPALGWDEFVEDLVIHNVPSSHHDILREPAVQIIATRLAADLSADMSHSSADDLRPVRDGDSGEGEYLSEGKLHSIPKAVIRIG